MRGLMFLVLLAVILPIAQPGLSSPSASMEMSTIRTGTVSEPLSGLILTEVCPGRPVEYVVITNRGPSVSLFNVTIDDGEGKVRIDKDIVLDRSSSIGVTVNRTIFSSLRPNLDCLQKGDDGIAWSGRFTLADDGDDVGLFSGGVLMDRVIYGKVQFTGEGWTGPSVESVTKGHAVIRTGADTNRSTDWAVVPPGRSSFPVLTCQAIVEPFSVPENAVGRLLRELSQASRTVNCSLYEITDVCIVNALAACSLRGVEVNVLIEGQPVGGLSEASLNASASLQAHGVLVKELRSFESYKRYDYLHAKYMIVDSRRVVIMSENWGGGLHVNRGWGVTLDSGEVGRYFEAVFKDDIGGLIDTAPARDGGSALPLFSVPEVELTDVERYRCEVAALVAPDNAAERLMDMIREAQEIILVEQLSVDDRWLKGTTLLTSLIDAAERGVQVRLLMGSSWGGGDNPAVADELNSIAQARGLDLEARSISSYHNLSVMHNKGLIIDDQVVVSSINWGDTSLYQNREVGAVVTSASAASYFSHLFWQDWSTDPEHPAVELPWTFLRVRSGEPVLLDATRCSDNAPGLSIEWDIDGDGIPESNETKFAVRLGEGNHTVVLTITDLGNNTVRAWCWVEVVPPDSEGGGSSWKMMALPLFAVAVIAWKTIIGRKGH
jgi:phosphatidylserine/phosphatidylglycerophosphate/cardiolipin synthase-like enzyme